MKRKILLVLLTFSFFLSGCNLLNPTKDSDKIIESLESEIEELENTLNNLQQEVDRLEEENAQLKDNDSSIVISQLENEIVELNEEIQRLEEVIELLNTGDSEYPKIIEKLNEEINSLKADKEDLISQIQTLTNKNNELTKTVEDLKGEVETLKSSVSSITLERDNYSTQLTAAKNDLKTLQNKYDSLVAESKVDEKTINELTQSITTLQNQVNNYQKENNQLIQSINAKDEEISDLKQEIADLKTNNNVGNNPELEAQISELTTQLQNLQEEYAVLKQQSQIDQDTIKDLQQQVKQLQEENAALKTQINVEYEITYELDGGKNNDSNIAVYTPSLGEVQLLPATKDGYTFLGWFSDQDFNNKVEYINLNNAEGLVLYARFIENVYVSNSLNVSKFNTQSATTNYEIYMGLCLYDKKTAVGSSLFWHKIAIKESDGQYYVSEIAASGASLVDTYDYLLLAYNSGSNPDHDALVNSGLFVGDKVGFSLDLTTLQQGEVELQLYIYSSGGTYSNLKLHANGGEVEYTNYYVDTETTILPEPTREGFIFLGWYDNDKLEGSKYTKIEKGSTGDKEFFAAWKEADPTDVWTYVSNPVTSDSQDVLPTTLNNYNLTWSSSNSNLYKIDNGLGYTTRLYQTHQTQKVTITVVMKNGNETITETNEIVINPVLYKDMEHPGAAYFSISSTTSYMNNSERYQTNQTLFSETFRKNMDMIYYAFAIPQADGTVTLNTQYLDEVKKLKNDGIRVLLVIDGANKAPLQAMVQLCNNDSTRNTFVKNILSLVKTHNFDGVDVDWEFPGTSGLDGFTTEIDQVNLNKLLRDLRSGLNDMQDEGGSNYILSVAIPGTSWGATRYDYVGNSSLGGINDYCDYANMMSYDLNNTEYTTHLSSHAPSKANGDYKFGCIYGTEKFISLGLKQEKIILGTAAYGKAYKITGTINTTVQYPGLGLAATLTQLSGVTGSYSSGTIYYTGITQLMKDSNYVKYTEMNGSDVVGSYLLNTKDKIYITYDSAEAVKAKCEYANAHKGMGVMVWAYGEDATDTVINTICSNLK